MKKMMALLLGLSLSTLVFAATETSSFRTVSNRTVALGDSLTQLISRTGQSPSSMKSIAWQDGANTINAMQYDYNIGDNVYSVTVVHEQVRKIEFRREI